MCVCMYVCMYVCVYVGMYVCMYVSILHYNTELQYILHVGIIGHRCGYSLSA